MITKTDHPEHKTVELTISGHIKEEDYLPIINHLEARIRDWGYANILEVVENFDGVEMSAFWDNLKFAARHFKDIKKCAVVSDKKWIQKMVNWSDVLVSMDLKSFTHEDIELARTWVYDNSETHSVSDKSMSFRDLTTPRKPRRGGINQTSW